MNIVHRQLLRGHYFYYGYYIITHSFKVLNVNADWQILMDRYHCNIYEE